MTSFLLVSVHALVLASLLSISHGVLKFASSKEHESYFDLLCDQWLWIALALSLYGVVFFYYVFVLRVSPISSLYPVYTGLSVFFVLLIGHWFFREPVTVQHVIGVSLIIVGIVVMGFSGSNNPI